MGRPPAPDGTVCGTCKRVRPNHTPGCVRARGSTTQLANARGHATKKPKPAAALKPQTPAEVNTWLDDAIAAAEARLTKLQAAKAALVELGL